MLDVDAEIDRGEQKVLRSSYESFWKEMGLGFPWLA